MDTKQYLSQVRAYNRKIKNKLAEIYKLQELTLSTTVPPKDVDVQSSGDKQRLASAVTKIVDLEKETAECIEKRDFIVHQIEELDDLQLSEVLQERYVMGKSWEEVASDMGYSLRYATKLHKKALLLFRDVHFVKR